jgi:hypothetical protein
MLIYNLIIIYINLNLRRVCSSCSICDSCHVTVSDTNTKTNYRLYIIHVFNLRETEVVICMILVNLRDTEVVICMILVNLRDTEVVICMILVILKRTDDLKHYLNIRQYTRPSLDIIGKQ